MKIFKIAMLGGGMRKEGVYHTVHCVVRRPPPSLLKRCPCQRTMWPSCGLISPFCPIPVAFLPAAQPLFPFSIFLPFLQQVAPYPSYIKSISLSLRCFQYLHILPSSDLKWPNGWTQELSQKEWESEKLWKVYCNICVPITLEIYGHLLEYSV